MSYPLAAVFAANAHRRQIRKDWEHTPYINHPLEVAAILVKLGVTTDEEVLSAAVLHGVLEDTPTKRETLVAEFGERVAALVEACSDDKSLPVVVRKQLQIEHAPTLCKEAQWIKLADKLSNISYPPPPLWSDARYLGYLQWSLAVCEPMFSAHEGLAEQIRVQLANRGVTAVTEEQLQMYYRTLLST